MKYYLTLEDRIEMEILDAGRDLDGIQDIDDVDDIIETYADGVAEELMSDIGFKEEATFAMLCELIHDRIVAELDYEKVKAMIEDSAKDALDWASSYRSAVEGR